MSKKDLLERCEKEEEVYQFDRFTRADALKLGLKIYENTASYPEAAAIEITLNNLVVFRYFPEGTIPDSELWLTRKRNTVELMHMSSLHFMALLEENGETLEGRKLDAAAYAAGGGGFPISLRGTGTVGSICVSGMKDHMNDHQLVIDSLSDFISHK